MKAETRRVFVGAIVACASACVGSGAGRKGSGSSAPAVDEERGDAARIVCEAECRRDARCNVGEPSAQCFARCPTLPVRKPPVWSAAWATELAACIDAASCDHDADEACVFAPKHRSQSGEACMARVPAYARASDCVVLQGIAPASDDAVRACIEAGHPFDRCAPDYDWK